MSTTSKMMARLLGLFWSRRQAEMRQRWRRSLPFGDYVTDRWARAARYGFGEGTSVYDACLVLGDVSVGTNTWIGPFTVLDGSGGLDVGSDTTISAGVQIYTHESLGRTVSQGESPISRARTVVGSHCYLGPNVIVAMGITIGDGAVVGANSLVLGDIPPGKRAHGNPCVVVDPD